MFSKYLLPTLTVIATGFASMPAVAGLNHTAIVEHLNSIGVTTSFDNCTMGDHDTEFLMGTYNSKEKHLCISAKATASKELLDEVVIPRRSPGG